MAVGYITVHPDSPQSFSVEIPDGTVLPIGRKPSPDGAPKLVIKVPEVSAQHAEIRATHSGWTLQDTGSTNGTQLNGEWLTPGREYPLKDGDQIKVAQVDLLVSMPHGLPQRGAEEEVDDRTHFRINIINATILVGDIRRFTTLMEQYASQPEVVMEAAHRIFQAISKEIFANRGQLEKIAGDAIMAYWQQEENRQAHAFRACTTALRVRTLVKALAQNPQFWPFRKHQLHLDMALCTGPAAAGALGRKESNPALLGDTANLAFRMEKLISDEHPGDILVEQATYELVNDLFVFQPLGQFNVKGRQKSVEVYRLIEARRSQTLEQITGA